MQFRKVLCICSIKRLIDCLEEIYINNIIVKYIYICMYIFKFGALVVTLEVSKKFRSSC